MPNTVIQLKKSATPSSVPSALANGELALNFADGILYYKSSNGSIASISGSGGLSYGIINANGTILVAGSTGDTFSILPGNFITVTGDSINDRITIDANLKVLYDTSNAAFDKANSISFSASGNTFTSISVPGQGIISAAANDTLNIFPGENINITTNSATKTVTISAQNIGANVDYGWINIAFLTTTQNYGSI